MATVIHQKPVRTKGHWLVLWEAVGDADVGDAVHFETFTDRTVQAVGTWDSATLVIQGSNDGTNWTTLNDLQSAAISLTGDGLAGIAEAPRYIRPSTSGGLGSTDVDVYVYAVSRR